LEQKVHETILEVNLGALVDNLNYYRSFLKPETKMVCMVKADAYGAGAVEVAKTLQDHRVDYLAVAVADEGVALRRAGITANIMIMNPEMTSFKTMFDYDLEPEVYSFRLLDALVKAARKEGITGWPVHIKLDTGMHRLGFNVRYGGTEVREYENSPDAGSNLAPPNPRTPAPPTEETERQMYYTLIDRLTAAGYEHYEISNFAKKGFRSRHNSNYWNGTPYIGLGAAAHSYDIRSRSWNVADINAYMEGIEHGERLFEEELLDDDTRYNDTVTVGLRTCEGINLDTLSKAHRDYCMKNARRYLDDGLLELVTTTNSSHTSLPSPITSHLKLSRRGLFVSDMVMSDLMKV
jgi:hypothetical protein